MILEYNCTNSGVDNADKLLREYPCAGCTPISSQSFHEPDRYWSPKYFHNLDIEKQKLKNRRCWFLLELSKELTKPNILRKASNPNGLSSNCQSHWSCGSICCTQYCSPKHTNIRAAAEPRKGEDVPIVLETMIRKSTQFALNANVLSVRHIGRPAQLTSAKDCSSNESVPSILVKLYSCLCCIFF